MELKGSSLHVYDITDVDVFNILYHIKRTGLINVKSYMHMFEFLKIKAIHHR